MTTVKKSRTGGLGRAIEAAEAAVSSQVQTHEEVLVEPSPITAPSGYENVDQYQGYDDETSENAGSESARSELEILADEAEAAKEKIDALIKRKAAAIKKLDEDKAKMIKAFDDELASISSSLEKKRTIVNETIARNTALLERLRKAVTQDVSGTKNFTGPYAAAVAKKPAQPVQRQAVASARSQSQAPRRAAATDSTPPPYTFEFDPECSYCVEKQNFCCMQCRIKMHGLCPTCENAAINGYIPNATECTYCYQAARRKCYSNDNK